jgi:hypothetical protein
MKNFAEIQMENFELLLKRCNLVKAGKIITDFIAQGEIYDNANFINRYLKLQGISPSMYHPKTLKTNNHRFYSEIFKRKAINKYIESLR